MKNKKSHIIECTNNYQLFVAHKNQQAISPKHVKALAASIKENGFLPSKPVQVWRDKVGKLNVIDGHHRVDAAASVGSFIYFVVEPQENAGLIGTENIIVRTWAIESFVKLYASNGIEDHKALLNYRMRGLSIPFAIAVLSGHVSSSESVNRSVRAGNFKVKETKTAELIVHMLEEIEDACPEIKTQTYLYGIVMMLPLKEFHLKTFIHKAKGNPLAIVKCASKDQALQVIEEVYNFRSSVKPNLAYMAKDAAQARKFQ